MLAIEQIVTEHHKSLLTELSHAELRIQQWCSSNNMVGSFSHEKVFNYTLGSALLFRVQWLVGSDSLRLPVPVGPLRRSVLEARAAAADAVIAALSSASPSTASAVAVDVWLQPPLSPTPPPATAATTEPGAEPCDLTMTASVRLRRVEGFAGKETAKFNQRVVAILGEQRDGFYLVRTHNEPFAEFGAKSTNLVALGELGENDGETQCSVPTADKELAVPRDLPQKQKPIAILSHDEVNATAIPSRDEAVKQMLEFVPQRTRPPNHPIYLPTAFTEHARPAARHTN